MIDYNKIFCSVSCLTEKSPPFRGVDLRKKWFKNADNRYLAEALQTFVSLNLQMFDFLKVTPCIEGVGKDVRISFRTDKYVGAIPLRSPDTGKQVGDFIVEPRYGGMTEYAEIIDLLQTELPPELRESPQLQSEYCKPPLYLECIEFINLLSTALRRPWMKFSNVQVSKNYPKAPVAWDPYAKKQANPAKRLVFPCHDNILTTFHREFYELKHVFLLAEHEISSATTPLNVRLRMQQKIDFLNKKLSLYLAVKTAKLIVRNSDPQIIKKVKDQANRILSKNRQRRIAWRIDFELLFERFVQYMFQQVAREIGGRHLPNYRIGGSFNTRPSWSLSYLEPDVLIVKNEQVIIADAKYKSHMLNVCAASEELKETHRRDIHQILAYSAFGGKTKTTAFLCYPHNQVQCIRIKYDSKATNVTKIIYLLGIPMKRSAIVEIQNSLIRALA